MTTTGCNYRPTGPPHLVVRLRQDWRYLTLQTVAGNRLGVSADEMNANWSVLGDLVRLRRERLGLSQREAAETAGISPTTWRSVELGHGDTTQTRTLSAMARALRWPTIVMDSLIARAHSGDLPDAEERATLVDRPDAPERHMAAPAALSGVDLSDLTSDLTAEELAQVRGYIDALRGRRRRDGDE